MDINIHEIKMKFNAFVAAHGLTPGSQPEEFDEITPEHAPWLEETE
jgi:hypothetical protein